MIHSIVYRSHQNRGAEYITKQFNLCVTALNDRWGRWETRVEIEQKMRRTSKSPKVSQPKKLKALPESTPPPETRIFGKALPYEYMMRKQREKINKEEEERRKREEGVGKKFQNAEFNYRAKRKFYDADIASLQNPSDKFGQRPSLI